MPAPLHALEPPTVEIPNLTGAPGQRVTIAIHGDEKLAEVGGIQFLLDLSQVSPADQPPLKVVDDGKTPPSPLLVNGDFFRGGLVSPQGLFPSPTQVLGAAVRLALTAPPKGPGSLVTLDVLVPANASPGTVYSLNLAPLDPSSGNFTISDAVILVRYGSGTLQLTDAQYARYDLDHNNDVDGTDAILMLAQLEKGTAVADTQGTLVPVTLAGGTLTVTQPKLSGDISGDNRANIADVVLLLRFMLKRQTPDEAQARAADVNGDGRLDIADALTLIAIILGVRR